MARFHRTLAVGLFSLAIRRSRINSSLAAALVDPSHHQGFADDLTAILYTQENEFTSALGVSMAFSLIYPGCSGDAVDQVRDTLGYPTGSNMQLVWEETSQRMLGNSRGHCKSGYNGFCELEEPLLQIANSVWFDDGDTLNKEYELVVGTYAKQINFTADDSPIIVNEWVKNSTNGLIDSVFSDDKPLYPPYVLIAINSIYLKASWKNQFEERKTNLDSFYGSTSRTNEVAKAHFMNMVEYFRYSHTAMPGYQVIDVPFAASQMSMIFVLPMTDSVGPVLSTNLLQAANGLQFTRIALSMPKFKFERKYEDDLIAAIKKTGIVAPFGPGSLCGLFEGNSCGLFVDTVIQKTFIDVNEEGVEAAAVTVIAVAESAGVPDTNDPLLMILDHPFQFFVYDKSEDLVLFEGRLGAPEIPETEPGLNAKHSDSDFWSNAFYVNPVDPTAQQTQSSNPSSSPSSEPSKQGFGYATTSPINSNGSSSGSPTTLTNSTSPTVSTDTLSNSSTFPTKTLTASPSTSPMKNIVISNSTEAPSGSSSTNLTETEPQQTQSSNTSLAPSSQPSKPGFYSASTSPIDSHASSSGPPTISTNSTSPTVSTDINQSTSPTKPLTARPSTSPMKNLVISNSTEAPSGSSSTKPSALSASPTSQPSIVSGSSSSRPTKTSSLSTSPSGFSSIQPSVMSNSFTTQPGKDSDDSDFSSGKRLALNIFLCACLFFNLCFCNLP